MRVLLFAFTLFLATTVGSYSSAGMLSLSLNQVTDISGLGASSIGGMTVDSSTGRLWVSDATNISNDVFEINPLTGTVFSSFNASVVPGLGAGPDAMAIQPGTGNLYLFSTFTETEAGVVTQGGALVTDFGSTNYDAGGAAFNGAGELYTVDEGNGAISRLNPITGAILSSTSLTGFTGRLGAADFDPITGNLFAYDTSGEDLLEIDVVTSTVLSTTDVSPFLSGASFPTGLAFNGSGDTLYIASGGGGAGDNLVVLNRSTGPGSVVPEPSSIATWAVFGMVASGWRRRRRNAAAV